MVIPNWNGKELLAKYLPSVVEALAGNPENEIIVVDNGSTDGSAEFLRTAFPGVKLLALPVNLGFGGGSNAGFRAARNRIVVLLNSDMRVAPDFLAPLLEGFRDPLVFAVSCQIFFSDPARTREETGLTQGWWQDGGLRVRHRIDPEIDDLFPCFYGGGGSCAFDRGKFLELGGFDPLLAPFYLEDTDLGYMAWKRGWKVLYHPARVVYHEHRGTIGKRFNEGQIQAVLKKNYLLFCVEEYPRWRRLAGHFFFAWAGAVLSVLFGDEPLRPNPRALWDAFRQLGGAMRSRWRARGLARVNDREAFRRPLGGYFRDRFAEMDLAPARPSVLFVSPYPICPPVHGGGVFMYQALGEMVHAADVHVVELLDWPSQEKENRALREFCASAEWIVRPSGRPKGFGSLLPRAVREFANDDLDWLIHRQLYRKRIDVVQLEYTPMAQYRGRVPPHRARPVRARRLFPIHRARPGPHDLAAWRRSRRASNICARCTSSCGCWAIATRCRSARRPTAITCFRSIPVWRRSCTPACGRASIPAGTASPPALASRLPCCSSGASGTIPTASRSIGSSARCCP